MITLTVHQKDVASLIEIELTRALKSLVFVERFAREYSQALGPDAEHFLKDLSQQASHAMHTISDVAECVTDHKDEGVHLAVWLHPDSLERLCQECADKWAPCGVCSRLMPIAEMVSRGESVSGHEGCLWSLE